MEREQIAGLLEKYWQAETTVEEERALADYFRGTDVPLEWAPYKEIFSYYKDEREVRLPSEDLEERIMEQLRVRSGWRGAWWAAAAAVILLLCAEPLLRVSEPVAGSVGPVRGTMAQLTIEDTYDDPQQALAAVQKALLVASRNMNKGLHPLK